MKIKIGYVLFLLGLLFSSIILTCEASAATKAPGSAKIVNAQWQQEWNKTLAAAKKEGALLVYTTSTGPSVRQMIVPKMKELFGVDMDVVSAPTDQLRQRLLTERQRGLYAADVLIAGPESFITYAGAISPIHHALILPEATDPKAWPDGKLPFIDENGFTLALTSAFWSYVVINTDIIKEGELKSFADLVQPKWKGKIVMTDPTAGGNGANCVTFLMRIMGEKGEKFLSQLAAQDLMLTRDSRIGGEWVARGKHPIALAPSMGAVTPLIAAGAPIAWFRMSEGGLMHSAGSNIALIDKSPHPNAGKALLNWLLTSEGQYILSKAYGQPAIRLGVSHEGINPDLVPKPGVKLFWIDEKFVRDAETKGREWSKRFFGHLVH